MHNYIEFFDNMPTRVIVGLMFLFGILQGIGEILEFKGKVVPEIMKVRKYFKRKKEERSALSLMPEMIKEHKQLVKDTQRMMVDYKQLIECNKKLTKENNDMSQLIIDTNRLLKDIDKHYSADNIAMRDGWMREVNEHIAENEQRRSKQDAMINALAEKLDKNNADTLSILIDNKRNYIIDFADKKADIKVPATREEYKRFFKVYAEYERIIEENDMTNGEVEIAHRMTVESYEERTKHHAFIEDVRGYNA
jgi:hypothetical protein